MIYVLKVPEVFPCTTTMCCELDNAKAKKGGAGKRTGGNATIKNAALRRWEDTHWIAHNAHTHTSVQIIVCAREHDYSSAIRSGAPWSGQNLGSEG